MRVEVLRKYTEAELEDMIRKVPLIAHPDVFVYENADIQVRSVSPEEVNPTSFYALRRNLDFQAELRTALMEQGIDTLFLQGEEAALELKNEKDEIWSLFPPVIELATERVKYQSREGEKQYDDTVEIKVPIINDGLHRVMLAKELGSKVNVLYISWINQDFPFYAHANNWNQVEVVDEIPQQAGKKYYLREKNYELYRNFGIYAVGAPRTTEQKQ